MDKTTSVLSCFVENAFNRIFLSFDFQTFDDSLSEPLKKRGEKFDSTLYS